MSTFSMSKSAEGQRPANGMTLKKKKRPKDTNMLEDGGVSMQNLWETTRKPGLALKAGVFTRNLQIPGTGRQLALLQSPVTALPKLSLHLSTTQ